MATAENGLSDAEVIQELLELLQVYGEIVEVPGELLKPSAERFAAALKKLKE